MDKFGHIPNVFTISPKAESLVHLKFSLRLLCLKRYQLRLSRPPMKDGYAFSPLHRCENVFHPIAKIYNGRFHVASTVYFVVYISARIEPEFQPSM